jgi:ech hydrogenase subunit F
MSHMLPTIVKNLFSKPATRRYPYEKRPPFKNSRGRIKFDMTRCDQCGDCQRVCPSGAIEIQEKEKLIVYDPFRCIYCWVCMETCLQKAISAEEQYHAPDYQKAQEKYSSSANPSDNK